MQRHPAASERRAEGASGLLCLTRPEEDALFSAVHRPSLSGRFEAEPVHAEGFPARANRGLVIQPRTRIITTKLELIGETLIRIPFHVAILVAAFASFVLSVSVWFFADRDAGLFVGIWVPSILSLGAFLAARR